MTEEELRKYESERDSAYAEMFSTQGWKYLMDYLTQQATRADSIENIDSMEELHLNRGIKNYCAVVEFRSNNGA